jgi:hypothetical protein
MSCHALDQVPHTQFEDSCLFQPMQPSYICCASGHFVI